MLVQRAGVRLDHRLDRDLAELDAKRLGKALRVTARGVRRVARRHRHAVHAVGAERLDAQRRGQCRVDATREPDHHVAEPVLRHVVVQAELEREPHLLQIVDPRGDRACFAEIEDEQLLLEARRPCEHLAIGRDDDRMAVEDELVLRADGVAERDGGAIVARSAAHDVLALAVLADVERRRGDVRDELRAGGA